MFILKVQGARRSTLAVHKVDSQADLRELIAVYEALGFQPEALIVEALHEEKAA